MVQLYIRDESASTTRPVKLLKAFQRVSLAAGQSQDVVLTLPPAAFAYWNAQMQEVVEPGRFAIMTGPNSVDLQTATLTIV